MITEGPISKALLSFFFPILFGTFFQQLYNTVDAVIVGRYLGKAALAAVGGGTGIIINLLIGFFLGLGSGASVVIAQRYGSGNIERTRKAIHTAAALALAGGLAISVLGYAFTNISLRLIGTPEEIMGMAATYMHIFFAGSLSLVIYNMGSGIFRALGDSDHPLYFLIASCLVNIVLDFLFVGALGMGVAGAALATVLSQSISMVLTIVYLMRLDSSLRLEIREIGFDRRELHAILRLGVPTGIQTSLYTISNLLIQSGVNALGTDSAAAWAAYSKIDAFYWMINTAFGISITTFVGQNYGAGNRERIRKGMWICTLMEAVVTLVIELFFLLFAGSLMGFFTADRTVIDIGVSIIWEIVPFFLIYIPIEMLSGVIKGCGKVFVSTVLTLSGVCLLRFVWMFTGVRIWPGITSIMFCYPLTWTVTALLFVVYYFRGHWMPKELIK